MKSKTNIFLLISFLIASILSAWLYYQFTNKIGSLTEDKEIDTNFQICDEDKIPEYYGMHTDYEGGKRAIREKIFDDLNTLNFENPGLITYRFIVNCRGEIGRFRFKSTNLDLQKNQINPQNIREIEHALLQLKNWNPAKNEYNSYDSYYVLNFKIRNRKIVDIF